MKKRKAALIAADIPVFAVCLAAPWAIGTLVRASGSDSALACGAAAFVGVWALVWLYSALTRAHGLRFACLTLWITCGAAVTGSIIFDAARLGAASVPRLAAYVTAVYYTRPICALFGEPDTGPRGWCAAACAAMIICFAAAFIIMPVVWREKHDDMISDEIKDEGNKIDENPYTDG